MQRTIGLTFIFLVFGCADAFFFSSSARGEGLCVDKLKAVRHALNDNWAEQAVELMDGPCESEQLRPFWELSRAEAFSRTGKSDEAIRQLNALAQSTRNLSPKHPLRLQVQSQLAQLLINSQPKRAAKLLGQSIDSPADWERARQIWYEHKNQKKADQLARRLLIKAPSSPPARRLAQKIGSDGVKRLLQTTEDRMQRIRNLLAGHDNRAAIREAKALKKGPACEKLYIVGKAQRKQRQYKKSIDSLQKARTVCPPKSQFWMRSSLLATQVHTIKRQIGPVKRIVRLMEKHNAKHSFIDDALIQLAKVYERNGQTAKAKKVFMKILKNHPSGDQVNFAAWRMAFAHIRAQDYRQAVPWLEKLRGRHEAQGKYWKARALEHSSAKKAQEAFTDLITAPPLTFYSWLALSRLEQIAPAEAKKAQTLLVEKRKLLRTRNSSVSVSEFAPSLTQALLLYSLGFEELAPQIVIWWTTKHSSKSNQTQAMQVLHKMKAFSAAQHILRWQLNTLLDDFPEPKTYEHWQIAYSLAYRKEIEAAAQKMKIDPLLLFALAREESTFDAQIVSWAGAMGLCQLMPATGIGAYADVYRKRLKNTDALLDPRLNAELGAHVLKQGLKRFNKIEALALAAYNGGPRLAQSTMPKKKSIPFDLWVESIGVRETRRYVKKVLQSWGRYRYLHQDKDFLVRFPKQVGPTTGKKPKKSARY